MPTAKVNGINLAYRVSGQGEPLIMIAGFTSSQTGWLLQRRAFSARYRTVTFDNRGAGRSDRPPGPYSMKMLAEDVTGLMDHLGIRQAHVLGLSMGGMVAQELAVTCPERVARLVLASTFARRDGMGGFAGELEEALGLEPGYADDDIRRIPPRRLVSTLSALSFNRTLHSAVFVPLAKLRSRLLDAGGLAARLEAILAHNALDRLGAVRSPTLVITGTRDRVIAPASSDALAGAIPGAALVRLAGGSHALTIERRRDFNREVLDFLSGN
jgi:3-oxoadipate enol-lactonase